MSVTIEEALIQVGTSPLVQSPYSKAIATVVNATLNDPARAVTLSQTGGSVLTLLYQLPDPVVRQQLLAKDLGGVRDKDYYRTVVLGFSVLLAVIAISMTIVMLMSTADTTQSANLLQTIVQGLFDVLKAIIGKDDPPSTP